MVAGLARYLSGLGLTDVELEPCADEASAQPVSRADFGMEFEVLWALVRI